MERFFWQDRQGFFATDLAPINTVFAWLGVLDKSCFLSKLIRSIYLRPLNPKQLELLYTSHANDTDLLDKKHRRFLDAD
jgi:hypothetical protein